MPRAWLASTGPGLLLPKLQALVAAWANLWLATLAAILKCRKEK